MNKKVLFIVFVVFAMLLASCGTPTTSAPAATDVPAATSAPVENTKPAATEAPAEVEVGEPEVCATDEFGCAVVPAGETVKLGMGAPMTGDYASFGVDI